MAKKSEPISVRLDPDTLRQLDRTRSPYGDSRGEHLKRIAIRALSQNRDHELNCQLTDLQESIARLDDALEHHIEASTRAVRRLAWLMLTNDGSMEGDEAKAVVARLFED